MFTKTLIERTLESNSDVSSTSPKVKQDCSDVPIFLFSLIGQATKEVDEKQEVVQSRSIMA